MELSNHQGQYNKIPSQIKKGIIELNTNYSMLAQNKLLTQIVDELTKELSNLPQQLKEIYEMPN